MKSEVESPSVWDIRRCLLSSIEFAEDFAHRHPEHAETMSRFTQELRRLKRELMSSFEDDSVLAPLHDIVNGLTGAKALAEIMAERDPEKSDSLLHFIEGLVHAQKELIRSVRPQQGE